MDNITKLNQFIYAGTKQVRDKIGKTHRNPKRTQKMCVK